MCNSSCTINTNNICPEPTCCKGCNFLSLKPNPKNPPAKGLGHPVSSEQHLWLQETDNHICHPAMPWPADSPTPHHIESTPWKHGQHQTTLKRWDGIDTASLYLPQHREKEQRCHSQLDYRWSANIELFCSFLGPTWVSLEITTPLIASQSGVLRMCSISISIIASFHCCIVVLPCCWARWTCFLSTEEVLVPLFVLKLASHPYSCMGINRTVEAVGGEESCQLRVYSFSFSFLLQHTVTTNT